MNLSPLAIAAVFVGLAVLVFLVFVLAGLTSSYKADVAEQVRKLGDERNAIATLTRDLAYARVRIRDLQEQVEIAAEECHGLEFQVKLSRHHTKTWRAIALNAKNANSAPVPRIEFYQSRVGARTSATA